MFVLQDRLDFELLLLALLVTGLTAVLWRRHVLVAIEGLCHSRVSVHRC